MNKLKELSIELTNECRLACLHCSSGSSPEKLPGELPISKHLELIEEARALGATTLSLSGGEPLLYGDSVGHVDYDASLLWLINTAVAIGYEEILLYTTGHGRNGNHIKDYKFIYELLAHDKLTFIFSLHDVHPCINDTIMNVDGTTCNVITSMEWLIEQGAQVNVHTVPMKPNWSNIPFMVEYCKKIGVKKLSFLRFVPQTRGKQNEDTLGMSREDFVEMQFLLHQISGKEMDLEIRMGCPIDFRHAIGLLPEKSKPCHAGDDLMLVRPTGDVHPCAAWKSLPCDTNAKDHSLEHIWESSEVFNRIRNFKRQMLDDGIGLEINNPCHDCSMLGSCLTGCPAQRIHAMPELGMDALIASIYTDPLCPRGNGNHCNCDEAISVEAPCDCGCKTESCLSPVGSLEVKCD